MQRPRNQPHHVLPPLDTSNPRLIRPGPQLPPCPRLHLNDILCPAPESSVSTPPNLSSHLSPPSSTPQTGESSPDPFPYFAKFTHGAPPNSSHGHPSGTISNGVSYQEHHHGLSQDRLSSSTAVSEADWVSDLHLLHHFTTSTYLTLTKGPRTELWQKDVPAQAFRHPFLLHQLLATAAFHLAYLNPQERNKYAMQASHHQSLAIRGIREVLLLPGGGINSDNCHAIFPTSSLLFVGALAASSTGEDMVHGQRNGPTIDDLIDVWLLVKGMGGVLDANEAVLRSGPIAGLFRPTTNGDSSPGLERLMGQLDKLSMRILQDAAIDVDVNGMLTGGDHNYPGSRSGADTPNTGSINNTSGTSTPTMTAITPVIGTRGLPRELEVVHTAVKCLTKSIEYALTTAANPEHQVIAAWPLLMSDEYISLLRKRAPPALALLSYYCVIMHATEVNKHANCWFTRGWGMAVMRDILRQEGMSSQPWNQDSAWALGWMTGTVGEVG